MTTKLENSLASVQIPNSYVAVTPTTDKSVAVGCHGPDAHDVALQAAKVLAMRTKDMYLGIIEGNNNVLRGQMQRCDHALVRCNGVR